jgi:hypothetical protein
MNIYDLVIAALLSGAAQLAVSMAVTALLWKPFAKQVHESFERSPIFRPMSDWRMGIYVPFVSPFVSGFLTAVAYQMFASSLSLPLGIFTLPLPWNVGVEFALTLWFVGAFHGIWIDHCCYRQSIHVTIWFQALTLVQALVRGAVIGFWLT